MMVAESPERLHGGWCIGSRILSTSRPLVMGILNLTPDSFSDGGELPHVEAALQRAARMVEEGAHILDVGGESTRPGALPVSPDEEIRRVVPVVKALCRAFSLPVSVDTRKASVAQAAFDAGAEIVNDVSGFTFDPELPRAAAEAGAGVVLMHMRGTPADMGTHTGYGDVVAEVRQELQGAVERALEAGVSPEAIVVDPGLGFAKTHEQSLTLLGTLDGLTELGFPVLVGPSRKRFLGELLGVPPQERAVGTAAACLMAYLGGARIFRVHDVLPTVEALRVGMAVREARSLPASSFALQVG